MTIQKLRCTCQDCKHVFDAEIVVDCPVDVAIASMKAVRCPECYSSKCGMGGNYKDAPPLTAPLVDRVAWWKDRGEHGVSSETIYSAFCGGSPRSVDVPHDPDDFRRCKLLLDIIPEWRADLGKIKTVYPWFAPLIDNWDEIERLFVLEEKSGKAAKCYEFMRPLVKLSRSMRHA